MVIAFPKRPRVAEGVGLVNDQRTAMTMVPVMQGMRKGFPVRSSHRRPHSLSPTSSRTQMSTGDTSYVYGWSAKENQRMDLQHEAVIQTFDGSALSEQTKSAARRGRIKTVIDLGVGTGAWANMALQELKRYSPVGASITVVGIDIYENEEWRKYPDVVFAKADVFELDQLKAVRERYTAEGKGFDLVHLRFGQTLIPEDKWAVCIKAFVSLARVDGLIQQEEADLGLVIRNNTGPLSTLMGYFGMAHVHYTHRVDQLGPQLAEWYTGAGLLPIHEVVTALVGPNSATHLNMSLEKMTLNRTYQDYMASFIPNIWLKVVAPNVGISDADARKTVSDYKESWKAFREGKEAGTDLTFFRMLTGVKSPAAQNIF